MSLFRQSKWERKETNSSEISIQNSSGRDQFA